jgi:hypothetical protein
MAVKAKAYEKRRDLNEAEFREIVKVIKGKVQKQNRAL